MRAGPRLATPAAATIRGLHGANAERKAADILAATSGPLIALVPRPGRIAAVLRRRPHLAVTPAHWSPLPMIRAALRAGDGARAFSLAQPVGRLLLNDTADATLWSDAAAFAVLLALLPASGHEAMAMARHPPGFRAVAVGAQRLSDADPEHEAERLAGSGFTDQADHLVRTHLRIQSMGIRSTWSQTMARAADGALRLPDHPAAHRAVERVLRPGGAALLCHRTTTWAAVALSSLLAGPEAAGATVLLDLRALAAPEILLTEALDALVDAQRTTVLGLVRDAPAPDLPARPRRAAPRRDRPGRGGA